MIFYEFLKVLEEFKEDPKNCLIKDKVEDYYKSTEKFFYSINRHEMDRLENELSSWLLDRMRGKRKL